jgi:hypothetical protein
VLFLHHDTTITKPTIMSQHTLSQYSINLIKQTMERTEGRLAEDISDSEVWEYVEDIRQANQDTWGFPRESFGRVASYLMDWGVDSYLSYI